MDIWEDSSTVNTQREDRKGIHRIRNAGLRCKWNIQVEMSHRQLKVREGAQERGGVRDEAPESPTLR